MSQWLVARQANKETTQDRFQSCRSAVRVERGLLLDAADLQVTKARGDVAEFKRLSDGNTAMLMAMVASASNEVTRARSELRVFKNVAAYEYAEGLRLAVGKFELKKAELEEHQQQSNDGLAKLNLAVAKAEAHRDALIASWGTNSIDAEATNRMMLVWGSAP